MIRDHRQDGAHPHPTHRDLNPVDRRGATATTSSYSPCVPGVRISLHTIIGCVGLHRATLSVGLSKYKSMSVSVSVHVSS